MSLTDLKIKSLPIPERTPKKYADRHGLNLIVYPGGTKSWHLRKNIEGKEQMPFIGHYPEISLAEARKLAQEMRTRIAHGLPAKEMPKRIITFGQVAAEWLELQSQKVTSNYFKDIQQRLEKHILPVFSEMDVTNISPSQVADKLQSIAATGVKDTVKRIKRYMSQIFKYGIIKEYCQIDPTYALEMVLPKHEGKHMPARTDLNGVRELFKACHYYGNSKTVRNALLFQALTATRPGNTQKAEWSEINFDDGIWAIGEGKMKMRREFKIPLSKAAMEVLEWQKEITANRKYIFEGRQKDRTISENTLNQALKSMCVFDHVPHGWRAAFKTIATESGLFRHDVIELCLAHELSNKIESAYNRSELWDERVQLMNWWADVLLEKN